jgi:hypothetical protein
LDADGEALRFEGGLEGEGVHKGAQHAHLVGDGAVDAALGGEGFATDEVSAPDDDGDFMAGGADLRHFLGDVVKDVGVEPKAKVAGKRLAT